MSSDEPACSTADVVRSVSVVIPTYNRCERLHRVLTALAAQDHADGFETIVVSDGSEDGTEEYLRSDEVPLPVVVCRQENSGPATARNRGVEAASGDLIVFLDDDVVPKPGFLREHVAAHRRLGGDVVVIGPMLNPPDHDMSMWVRYEQAMLAKQYDAMTRGDWSATARQFYTGNASLLRRHLVEAGGFNSDLRRAEDIELAIRLADAGLEFDYVSEAVGLHYAERSFESWRDIATAYGENDVSFSRELGHADLLRVVLDQFGGRHPVIRFIVRLAGGRRRVTRVVDRVLLTIAGLGETAGAEIVPRMSLSGIYNLAYYSGVMDGLGGRGEFWRARRRLVTIPGIKYAAGRIRTMAKRPGGRQREKRDAI